MVFVIMGVSGCGKSTIGKLLAAKLSIPFFDADAYHPENNIQKMSKGVALTDKDRLPWLTTLSEKIESWNLEKGAVLACSALKENYRQILSNKRDNIKWVYLDGSKALIKERLESRENHFMKADLLTSQFQTLEIPNYGIHISIQIAPEKIIDTILKKI